MAPSQQQGVTRGSQEGLCICWPEAPLGRDEERPVRSPAIHRLQAPSVVGALVILRWLSSVNFQILGQGLPGGAS